MARLQQYHGVKRSEQPQDKMQDTTSAPGVDLICSMIAARASSINLISACRALTVFIAPSRERLAASRLASDPPCAWRCIACANTSCWVCNALNWATSATFLSALNSCNFAYSCSRVALGAAATAHTDCVTHQAHLEPTTHHNTPHGHVRDPATAPAPALAPASAPAIIPTTTLTKRKSASPRDSTSRDAGPTPPYPRFDRCSWRSGHTLIVLGPIPLSGNHSKAV